MLVTFLRTMILYLVVVFGIRLMGKRQIGELQPSELVITILISNIATLTIEETDSPMFAGLLPILALMCFEVLTSFLCLKSARLRRIVSGRPIIIIHDGKIDQREMRELRFSADDLMIQLRQNGIFRAEEVEFAVVETNGKLSVYQKYQNRPITPQVLAMPDQPEDNAPPLAVVCEGTVMHEALRRSGATFGGETLSPPPAPITKADLLERGLIGPGSVARRQALLRELSLPAHLTPNALLEALNILFTPDEFDAQFFGDNDQM